MPEEKKTPPCLVEQEQGASKIGALMDAICDKAAELDMSVGELMDALLFARTTIAHRFKCRA